MTQPRTVDGLWALIQQTVIFLGSLLGVAAGIIAFVFWLAGGLKPQAQVATETLAAQLSQVKTDVSDKLNQVQADVSAIKKTIDVMPRPYEFDEQKNRVGRLEASTQGLAVNIAGLTSRVDALEKPQYRNPRN